MSYIHFFMLFCFRSIWQGREEPVYHCEWGVWSRKDGISQIRHEILCYSQRLCQRGQRRGESLGFQPHHGGEGRPSCEQDL